MTINKKKQLIKIIFCFVLGFAVTSLVPTQIITMARYKEIFTFLLLVIAGIVKYFKDDFSELVRDTKLVEILFFISVSLFLHGLTSYIILRYLNQPKWPFDSSGTSFLLMNKFYVWVKPLDIFVQQLLITLFVIRLRKLKLNISQITKILIVGFGFIHLFQIFKTNLAVGLTFTFTAVVFSILFPRMILKVKNGYAYNFMIHLGIYNLAAILSWLLF